MMDPKLKAWSDTRQIPVRYYESLASTNTTAHQSTAEAGTIFLTDRQTAGKGQKGNRWESRPGENLTFSIVLYPDFLPVELQFYISKITALALVDTLSENGIHAHIKWPNDIYVGDRKIAGILIENDVMGGDLSRSIVGVGLNINQTEFDPDIPNPTSVALETAKKRKENNRSEGFNPVYSVDSEGTGFNSHPPTFEPTATSGETTSIMEPASPLPSDGLPPILHTPADWLIGFYENFSVWYNALGLGKTAEIDRSYKAVLYRLNQAARYLDTATRRSFDAVMKDVRPTGELILEEIPGKTIRQYLFKEVEFVLPFPDGR